MCKLFKIIKENQLVKIKIKLFLSSCLSLSSIIIFFLFMFCIVCNLNFEFIYNAIFLTINILFIIFSLILSFYYYKKYINELNKIKINEKLEYDIIYENSINKYESSYINNSNNFIYL